MFVRTIIQYFDLHKISESGGNSLLLHLYKRQHARAAWRAGRVATPVGAFLVKERECDWVSFQVYVPCSAGE